MVDVHAISHLATGRDTDLFAEDLRASEPALRERLRGARILAIGAAGSIGAATVTALIRYAPAAVHVVDQNENALAELVRDIRSGPSDGDAGDLRALPLDYGAPVMRRFLEDAGPYDLILNFAALKHVRSEKDVYSLIQLLHTNLTKQAQLLDWLTELGFAGRYFSVSTDKAANPVSAMGATKRLMEDLIFSRADTLAARVTSARFANVAFSSGSLLEGFLSRLGKQQPIAVPRGIRRYFVTLREAGQICLLASVIAPSGHIVVPKLDPDADMKSLDTIAMRLVEHFGFQPQLYSDEATAKASMEADLEAGRYPILVTEPDTTGEKSFEEFVGRGEQSIEIGLTALAAVPYVHDVSQPLGALMARLEGVARGTLQPSKTELVSWLREAAPTFAHKESSKHLDQRM